MQLVAIERLVAAGESDTLELKQSTGQLRRAAETLCRFLNAQGGVVVFGVTPNGRIVGQDVSDSTLRDVANMLRQFEPPAPIDLRTAPLPGSGRELLILQATPSGESLPFTYDGRPYERIGSTTSIMPQERYRRLLFDRTHSRERWENAPAGNVDLAELDQEEILRTVRIGIGVGRLPEATIGDPGDVLDRLGLRTGDKLLNAAIVLFGTRLLPFYPQCQVRLARFRGVTKSEFIDNRQVIGHAFHLFEEAMLFLGRHLPVAGRIVPGLLEREDQPLIPIPALREAVVNAICHRDYTDGGGAVSIAIYDDRLEVWSSGVLPFGLRPADLITDHASRPRNPLIADTFYRRGLVERWGRGTQNIVDLCLRARQPRPQFIERAGEVGVRFLLQSVRDVNLRQRAVLSALSGAERLSLREIRTKMPHVAERALREDLATLKRLGLIRSEGRGRGAIWYADAMAGPRLEE